MLRAIDGLGDLSLTAWWPARAVLLFATVLALALMLRYARRLTSILLATALLAGLVVVNLAAAGNAYYNTYPTISALIHNQPTPRPEDPIELPPTGKVVPVSVPAGGSGFTARQAMVYLPRAWFAQPRPSLPVVLLLHGSPGMPSEWIAPGDAARIADRWADQHEGVAPVLVIPDVTGTAGTGVCADTPTGNVETYLTTEIPAFMEKQFSVRPPGRGWVVAGHTAGGNCALTLALRHPELFAAFADFGGPGGTVTPDRDPVVLLSKHDYPGLAGWFQVGDADPTALATTTQAVRLAKNAQIDTCLVIRPRAGPGPATWSPAFADALPWMAARLSLIPQADNLKSACGQVPPA